MGGFTIASGPVSTAMGYQTTASGAASTAMGHHTTASGFFQLQVVITLLLKILEQHL